MKIYYECYYRHVKQEYNAGEILNVYNILFKMCIQIKSNY